MVQVVLVPEATKSIFFLNNTSDAEINFIILMSWKYLFFISKMESSYNVFLCFGLFWLRKKIKSNFSCAKIDLKIVIFLLIFYIVFRLAKLFLFFIFLVTRTL